MVSGQKMQQFLVFDGLNEPIKKAFLLDIHSEMCYNTVSRLGEMRVLFSWVVSVFACDKSLQCDIPGEGLRICDTTN